MASATNKPIPPELIGSAQIFLYVCFSFRLIPRLYTYIVELPKLVQMIVIMFRIHGLNMCPHSIITQCNTTIEKFHSFAKANTFSFLFFLGV